MESSCSGSLMKKESESESESKWADIPSDILATISRLLGPTIGVLRLRSVCHPWRISLPLLSALITSPLLIPSPLTLSDSPIPLRPRLFFLFTGGSVISDGVRFLGSGSGSGGGVCDQLIAFPVPSTNINNCGGGGASIFGSGDGINDHPGPNTNNNNCGVGGGGGGASIFGSGDGINDPLLTCPGPSTNGGGAGIFGFGDGINDQLLTFPAPSTNNNNCGDGGGGGGASILGFGDGISHHLLTFPAPSIANNNCGGGGGASIFGYGDGFNDQLMTFPTPSTDNNNCDGGGGGGGAGILGFDHVLTVPSTKNNNCDGASILGLGDGVVGKRATSFLVNVEQITPEDHNRFKLLTPLSSEASFRPNSSLNLLDFGVTFVCVSYALDTSDFRKIVVLNDSRSDHGDLVVLGLMVVGKLVFWKQGDTGWTPIISHVRIFNDIATHNGKFYATADDNGRLLTIDVIGGRAIDVVSNLMYGSGFCSSLIGCDAGLYLVDRVSGFGGKVEVEVFKLDEKGRFWDYEFDVNDCVFFLGDGVNLWLSRKDYRGDVRNVIYFHHDEEDAKIWVMKTRSMCSLVDNKMCCSLFSPPIENLQWR